MWLILATVATASPRQSFVTVRFSFDGEPTVNSQGELAVARLEAAPRVEAVAAASLKCGRIFLRRVRPADAEPVFKLCGFFQSAEVPRTHKTGSPFSCSEDRLLFPERKEYTSLMQRLTLPVILESDQDGYFVSCPALQGCYSQGETYEEAMANIKDAMRLHLEDRLANGEEIPEAVSVSLSTVEVSV